MTVIHDFPRSIRLNKPSEYSSVFAFRRVIRAVHFSVFAKPNHSVGKLGITISKRVANRAVDRNYMKRVVREIYRLNKSSFNGFDLVVQVKTIFHKDTFESIQRELLAAVEQMCTRKN